MMGLAVYVRVDAEPRRGAPSLRELHPIHPCACPCAIQSGGFEVEDQRDKARRGGGQCPGV